MVKIWIPAIRDHSSVQNESRLAALTLHRNDCDFGDRWMQPRDYSSDSSMLLFIQGSPGEPVIEWTVSILNSAQQI